MYTVYKNLFEPLSILLVRKVKSFINGKRQKDIRELLRFDNPNQ